MLISYDVASIKNLGVGAIQPSEPVFTRPVCFYTIYDGMDRIVDGGTVIGMNVFDPPLACRPDTIERMPICCRKSFVPKDVVGGKNPSPRSRHSWHGWPGDNALRFHDAPALPGEIASHL